MCWGIEATAGMVAVGSAAAVVSWRRGAPASFPLALGYFALMEALQFAGYLVVDDCGSAANRTVTLLSMLHIVFQPIVINAFALDLVRPGPTPAGRRTVLGLACLASAVMLLQLLPIPALGACVRGQTLCGTSWSTVTGNWHIAWDVPYNGLLVPLEAALGTSFGFPTYPLAVFVMPVFYGAWRFAVFHAIVGPILASQLTGDANEAPAVWCLFSIGIALIALVPPIRRPFERRGLGAF